MQKALGNLSCRLSQRRGGNIISTCTSFIFVFLYSEFLYFVFCILFYKLSLKGKEEISFPLAHFSSCKGFSFSHNSRTFLLKHVKTPTWIASYNHHPDQDNNPPSWAECVREYRPDPGSRGKTDRGRPLCSWSCEVSRDLVCAALRDHFLVFLITF